MFTQEDGPNGTTILTSDAGNVYVLTCAPDGWLVSAEMANGTLYAPYHLSGWDRAVGYVEELEVQYEEY